MEHTSVLTHMLNTVRILNSILILRNGWKMSFRSIMCVSLSEMQKQKVPNQSLTGLKAIWIKHGSKCLHLCSWRQNWTIFLQPPFLLGHSHQINITTSTWEIFFTWSTIPTQRCSFLYTNALWALMILLSPTISMKHRTAFLTKGCHWVKRENHFLTITQFTHKASPITQL